MEKLIKKTALIILLISTIMSGIIKGQDKTRSDISKTILLKSESELQNIKLTIDDNCTFLKLNISATIQKGEVTIEIFDPKGEKQGTITLKCSINGVKTRSDRGEKEDFTDSKSNETSSTSAIAQSGSKSSKATAGSSGFAGSSSADVYGQLNKSINNPMTGDWIVNIIPKNATGRITIDSNK